MKFTDHSLIHIMETLKRWRASAAPGHILSFTAPDPDPGAGCYPGERVTWESQHFCHHSYRSWLDLAEVLGCRFLTPLSAQPPFLTFRLEALDYEADWRDAPSGTEKYGQHSPFARINKLEEPWFLNDYLTALEEVGIVEGMSILELGCNTGDSLSVFPHICHSHIAQSLTLTGVDHSASAIEKAQARFPQARMLCADLRDYHQWRDAEPYDLIISVGTLQSPGVDGRNLFPKMVKELLAPGGSVILGFPNVRYVNGELEYGARMKNYQRPELSLLVKDLFYYRRFLQQKGFKVILTGKYYVFLMGTSSRKVVQASKKRRN